ncbi:Putative WD-repeat family protein [Giardia duodenalis]|nr:Putative WD-repeat family protein [Giardia intestinalis]
MRELKSTLIIKMSADALRRQSALQDLEAIKKAGGDVASILREQVQALSKVATKEVLPHFKGITEDRLTLRGGHKMEFTCIAHSDDIIYLGSGDGTVSAWSLQPHNINSTSTEEKPLKQLFIIRGRPKIRVHGRKQPFHYDIMGVKLNRHPYASIHSTSRIRDPYHDGHFGGITALAASADGAYVASAGLDCLVNVRNGKTGKSLFSIILDNIALSMRIFGHTLTICMQSTLKVFNLDDHCEMFTLRGHEDQITGCAIMDAENNAAITCSIDKSVRFFDYNKQTQLIFTSGVSLECVCWPRTDVFIAGCSLGLLVHTSEKRKPVMQVHPHDCLRFLGSGSISHTFVPSTDYCRRLVTALDCITNGDLVISGCHGLVSLWKCVDSNLDKVADYAVDGFVNDLKLMIQHTKLYVLVALGKTPARGRWDRDPAGYNGLLLIDLKCPIPMESKGSSRFRARVAM